MKVTSSSPDSARVLDTMFPARLEHGRTRLDLEHLLVPPLQEGAAGEADLQLISPPDLLQQFADDFSKLPAFLCILKYLRSAGSGYSDERTACLALWELLDTEGTIWDKPKLQAATQKLLRRLLTEEYIPESAHRVTHYERIAHNSRIAVSLAHYLKRFTLEEVLNSSENTSSSLTFACVMNTCAESAASQFNSAYWPIVESAIQAASSSPESSCLMLLLLPALSNLLERRSLIGLADSEDQLPQPGDSRKSSYLITALQNMPIEDYLKALAYFENCCGKRRAAHLNALVRDLGDPRNCATDKLQIGQQLHSLGQRPVCFLARKSPDINIFLNTSANATRIEKQVAFLNLYGALKKLLAQESFASGLGPLESDSILPELVHALHTHFKRIGLEEQLGLFERRFAKLGLEMGTATEFLRRFDRCRAFFDTSLRGQVHGLWRLGVGLGVHTCSVNPHFESLEDTDEVRMRLDRLQAGSFLLRGSSGERISLLDTEFLIFIARQFMSELPRYLALKSDYRFQIGGRVVAEVDVLRCGLPVMTNLYSHLPCEASVLKKKAPTAVCMNNWWGLTDPGITNLKIRGDVFGQEKLDARAKIGLALEKYGSFMKETARRIFSPGSAFNSRILALQNTKELLVQSLQCAQFLHRGSSGIIGIGEMQEALPFRPQTSPWGLDSDIDELMTLPKYIHDPASIQRTSLFMRHILKEAARNAGLAHEPYSHSWVIEEWDSMLQL